MRSVRTTYSSSRGPTLPSELEHSPPSHDTSSRSSPKELRGVRATREEDKDLERQPSGYCIYGLGGELLHAPEGARCPVVKAASRSAGSGAAARPGGAGSCLSGDCAEGNGSYGWPDGSRFVGTFEGGRPHGYGTLVRPDGSSYVGDWRHGLRSGQGMGISADGRVQSGVWNEGRFSGGGPRTRNIAVESFHWPDLSRPAARVGGGEGDAAVIVGLETYAYVPEIPLAAENASAWYRYLIRTRGVPLDRVALLIDDDATLEEMESAARTAGERVK